MDKRRLWRTFRLWTSKDRSKYLRKAHIFAQFGENSTMSMRKIPLYPELISRGMSTNKMRTDNHSDNLIVRVKVPHVADILIEYQDNSGYFL